MPFHVESGAAVAVVAPAGPVDQDAYRVGLSLLEDRFHIVQAHDPGEGRHPRLPYLMGTDGHRAATLNQALADPQVEAVFCARGGYGAMRILDELDWEPLLRRRVPIVGFSDCTALHLWAAGLTVPSIHGPVVTQLGRLPKADQEALFHLLGGQLPRLEGLDTISAGHACGRLVGGNLNLVAHLVGTRYLPDLRGAILLLEEVNEAPYRVDRQLTQLRLAGVLDQLAGIVVGTLHNCDSPDVRAVEVIGDRLSGLGIPVVAGAPVGHGERNVALPLGVEAELDGEGGTLVFTES